MLNVIHATGALRKYLEARAQGAPRELLMQLSADSLAELEAERLAAKPARAPRLKLIWPASDVPEESISAPKPQD